MAETDTLATLARSALAQAANERFETVSLRDIATHAGLDLAACADAGVTREALIAALDGIADRQMLADCESVDLSQPPRDRLFEVIMARFDALEADRAGWTSILLAETGDAAALASRVLRRTTTARWVLAAAGISDLGVSGAMKIAGLARTLRRAEAAWLEDGPDLARTMAALDKDLSAGAALLARLRGLKNRVRPTRDETSRGQQASGQDNDAGGGEPVQVH